MSSSADCPPFDRNSESISEFLIRFKLQCSEVLGRAKNSNQKQIAILSRALPVSIITDLQRKLKPVSLAETDYDTVEEILISTYEQKISTVSAAVKFFNRKQQQEESIEDYSRALNELATHCYYDECCRDRLLKDVFVAGLFSSSILAAVLQKAEKLSFAQCTEHAKLVQQIQKDAREMSNECRSFKVSGDQYQQRTFNKSAVKSSQNPTISPNYVCFRCGAKAQHLVNECFAINLTCKKCNKKGHIQKVCRQRNVNTIHDSKEWPEQRSKAGCDHSSQHLPCSAHTAHDSQQAGHHWRRNNNCQATPDEVTASNVSTEDRYESNHSDIALGNVQTTYVTANDSNVCDFLL